MKTMYLAIEDFLDEFELKRIFSSSMQELIEFYLPIYKEA